MNKNTRRLKTEARKAARSGNRDVISSNKARNIQMIRVLEVSEQGKTIGSITRHIAIDANRPSAWLKRPKSPKGNVARDN